jgi:hypothetical protein
MTDSSVRPTFDQVYSRLQVAGPGRAVSSKGATYRVTSAVAKGQKAIIAWPRSSRITIHEDCWGENTTCQRTRAGGVYNGKPSIYDWYESSSRDT